MSEGVNPSNLVAVIIITSMVVSFIFMGLACGYYLELQKEISRPQGNKDKGILKNQGITLLWSPLVLSLSQNDKKIHGLRKKTITNLVIGGAIPIILFILVSTWITIMANKWSL
jgi:hypothetical protein